MSVKMTPFKNYFLEYLFWSPYLPLTYLYSKLFSKSKICLKDKKVAKQNICPKIGDNCLFLSLTEENLATFLIV